MYDTRNDRLGEIVITKQKMVSLSRFTEMRDRAHSEIFTFIVPKTILSDYVQDVQSKDFSYAYQRWFLSFTKTEYHLSASLHLRTSPSPNAVTCILDYTLLLQNREHFSRNEIYNAKDAVFTSVCSVQSSPNFVGIPDLLSRQFTDDQGEFIVDLILRNPRSFYEDSVQVPVRQKGRPLERLESAYFAFGNLEWNLVLLPNPSGTILKLNRMTHFEHSCQTRFRVTIGPENGNHFMSGILDSRSDLSGTGESITANKLTLENYLENNLLKVKVEMFSANLLSELIVPALHQSVQFYDRDKQGWHLQTYACEKGDAELLKLKMFYSDVKHIPRDSTRYVSWKVMVHPTNNPPGLKSDVLGPFVKYYQQRDVDFSFEISTKASLSQELAAVRSRRSSQNENGSPHSESTLNSYTVVVEWLQLHLLTPANFHHYDDFHRKQYHQMRLELATVQKECYSLERTLLQYQHGVKPQYHPADQDTRSGIEMVNGI